VRAGTAVFIPGHAEHAVRNTGTKPLHFVYVFPIHSFDEVEYEFTDA
jgi:oxalate decarboxylase/phosphoglucose isomerase-like protein (cupin superfamily)